MFQYLQSHKVILTNVIVTFIETFVATLALSDAPINQASMIGAGGAAASVVWNTIIKPALKSRGILYEKPTVEIDPVEPMV